MTYTLLGKLSPAVIPAPYQGKSDYFVVISWI